MITAWFYIRKTMGVGLLAFWVAACASSLEAPPTAIEPPAQGGAQATVTDLPPIGGEGSTIIADAPNPAPNNEAVVDTIQILISESVPVQVSALVKGKLPDGCVKIERISQERSGNTFTAAIFTSRQPDAACIAQLQVFEQLLPLDVSGLTPGTYTMTVSGANNVSTTFQLSGESPLPATATLMPFPSPSPSPLPLPTALPIPASTSISGVIWADFCQLLANGSPSLGCIPDGRGGYRADGTYAPGEVLLTGVQVTLNRGGCTSVNAYAVKLMTDAEGFYYFGDLEPGPYCVSIETQIEPNRSLLRAGAWSYPVSGEGRTEVMLGPGENKTADFGWDQFEQPQSNNASCLDEATYVTDVSIPDNTVIAPGASFIKTWRVRNTGTCTWGNNYVLVFSGGEAMAGQAPVLLAQPVQPGGEIDLSIALVAPLAPGIYRGEWRLQNDRGVIFGSRGNYPFYVQIAVGEPATSPAPTNFTISGVVWEDFCQVLQNGSPSGGCVLAGTSGTYRADGLYNNGEHGLVGVQVKLSVGECPGNNFVFITATTAADGAYAFNNLQAGPHCVSIDPLTEPNASLLLPGAWTYPAPEVNNIPIIVGVGQNQIADFGWDYQLH